MGNLVLNGATSGSTTLQPTDAVTTTLTLPSISGTVSVNGPAFSAYQTSNQSISANTWTKIQFQAKEFDTNSNFDNTTNYRFTPTVAGYYQINAATVLSSTVTTCALSIYKNGSLYKVAVVQNSSIAYPPSAIACVVYCNGSTDYIEIYVQANGNQTLQGVQANTWVNGSMVRGA